ncbi:YihY/virulence factor BrkB family protein [Halostella sp. JP-L12]|uniref:YihY/virulence factor BrkB family protein n=1 Tax=Halostella TaxID=1843185 RepID=UPI000EF81A64|nr:MULTISPECIES: YihY/virulence factor BrkB family protein [Halostella]NHN48121.1 YihY/virulence factor BrkB family protein [Halostella sp. JP-L12]
MRARLRRALAVVVTVVRVARRKNIPFMAGSIAYNAFVSLLPLLLILFLVVAAVGDDPLALYVVRLTEEYLTPTAQLLVASALSDDAGQAGLSAISAVTLLWGTFKIFRGIDTAFGVLYGVAADSSIVDQLRDGAVVLFAVLFAILAAGVAGAAFAMFPEIPFIGVLNPLLLVAGLTLAFFPMYYVFPDADVTAREVVPGTVTAAVGWAALEAVFQAYAAVASTYEVYGTIGAVLLLLTWLYFGGLVLLLGAVVNVVLADRLDEDAAAVEDGDDLSIDDMFPNRSG